MCRAPMPTSVLILRTAAITAHTALFQIYPAPSIRLVHIRELKRDYPKFRTALFPAEFSTKNRNIRRLHFSGLRFNGRMPIPTSV